MKIFFKEELCYTPNWDSNDNFTAIVYVIVMLWDGVVNITACACLYVYKTGKMAYFHQLGFKDLDSESCATS